MGESGRNYKINRITMIPGKKTAYVGLARHQLDAKNRLTLPSKWRIAEDHAEYLAIPNPEGFIHVYPPRMVERLEEQVSKVSLGDTDGQALLMQLFSAAHSFTYDRQGRFGLTEELIQHAGITKEAVFVGGFTTFSIWTPSRYEERPSLSKPQNEILRQLGL